MISNRLNPRSPLIGTQQLNVCVGTEMRKKNLNHFMIFDLAIEQIDNKKELTNLKESSGCLRGEALLKDLEMPLIF